MDQSSVTQSEGRSVPFRFTGSGGEFFKIWIVNLVLSILTLGIYSAWAKVRTNRYFYGNTQFENGSFEYHASPIAILKGRIIAVTLLLVYTFIGNIWPTAGIAFAVLLALVTPWVIWRSIQFNARMTSYRNVRFNFKGALGPVYKYMLVFPVLPIIMALLIGAAAAFASGEFNPQVFTIFIVLGFLATYLIVPYIQKAFTAYYLNNYLYGQEEFDATLSSKKYYKIYLALIGWSFLMMIGIIGLVVVVSAVFGGGLLVMQEMMNLNDPETTSQLGIGLILTMAIAVYVPMLIFGVWFKAYLNTKIRNYVYGNTKLGEFIKLESKMTVMKLFGFYMMNILLMIISLGLAYPWVKVRIAHFNADATHAEVQGDLNTYVTKQQSHQSALGDEMGEAFDTAADVGLAF